MTDREVMQQALDWINDQGKAVFARGGMNAVDGLNEVSKALTVAIAQPEQQTPVAWAIFAGNGNMRLWSRKESYVQARGDELGLPLVPLYAYPIAQPEQETTLVAPAIPGIRGPRPFVFQIEKPASQIEKLLHIIANAYQIAGACDVPDHILDVLANPHAATQDQIDAMLPYMPAIAQPKQPDAENALSNLLCELDSLAGNGMIPWQIEDAFAEYQKTIAQPKDKP